MEVCGAFRMACPEGPVFFDLETELRPVTAACF